ncbi:hypothetical protein [Micromonospora sp. CPCC 205558]|uniref:hypothetical protein n=1 Tax=Micromonospora sp. CPCC 205558 TaxID=3122403 RepID=UPI002FF0F68B
MILHWMAAALTVRASDVAALLAAPEPTPTPSGSGFDFDRINPDPAAVPRSDLFYTLANAALFLGVVSAVAGLAAGAIAFGVGPIFGAHIISDRGKSMMWKAGLVAIVIGSTTTIISFLLTEI